MLTSFLSYDFLFVKDATGGFRIDDHVVEVDGNRVIDMKYSDVMDILLVRQHYHTSYNDSHPRLPSIAI